MEHNYSIQLLDISSDWTVVRNVFFNIDPKDNIPEDDKYANIYCQEDLLHLTKDNYHIDLGWYGYDKLTNDKAGYCIHLFRGENWNNAELLEIFRSKDKQVIVYKIVELTKVIDLGKFDKVTGYKVDENDPTNHNDFSDFDIYNARQTK